MKKFKDIGTEIGSLVQEKNEAYGDSFQHSGEILKFLFPKGISPDKYPVCLALVRILDKIFRLATNPNYNNENCWHDIAGYCILMSGYERSKNEAQKPDMANHPVKKTSSGFVNFDVFSSFKE